MRERNAEQTLAQGIRDLGGMALKIAPTTAGLPDRLLLLPGGKTVLVEMKSEVGHLSPIQQHWHDKAARIGHHVVTLYGVAQTKEFLAFLAAQEPDDQHHDDHHHEDGH